MRPCHFLLTGALSLGVATAAEASGFAIQEYSVRDLGAANAGFAALASDATTVFSNPAGMTRLDGIQVNAGVHGIFGKGTFSDLGSRDALGQPLSGGNGGDILTDSFIPNLYGVLPLSDRLRAGIGISAPFGLASEYEDDWIGRYQAVKASLLTIDINPAVAYALTDNISIGAGVSLQYVDVEISNAVDFGAVCLGRVEPVAPGTCPTLGLLPQAADGFTRLKGKDWSWGFNVGVLFQVTPQMRLGLQYRSEVDHDLTGRADFTTPDAAAPLIPLLGGVFTDTDARASITLPERASLSILHQVNDRLALMGDISWTGWSSFEELRVTFENPAQPALVEEQDYNNTWRFAAGAEYRLSPALAVRGGLAFDETPTNDQFRSPRIPDNDRTILALGMSWGFSPNLTVDAAYNHIFISDSSLDRVGSTGERLIGDNRGNADLLALAVNLAF